MRHISVTTFTILQYQEPEGVTHHDAHFIYCSDCGFYPSDTTERVGIHSEDHAENLSELHRSTNPGHETFLVPGSWLSDTAETYVQRGFR